MTIVELVAVADPAAADEEVPAVALVVELVPSVEAVLVDVDEAVDELDEEDVVVLPVALDARPVTSQSDSYIKMSKRHNLSVTNQLASHLRQTQYTHFSGKHLQIRRRQ